MTRDDWLKKFNETFPPTEPRDDDPAWLCHGTACKHDDGIFCEHRQGLVREFIAEMLMFEHARLYRTMRMRCLLGGCVYGIEGVDKKPKKKCIYCFEDNKHTDAWYGEPIMEDGE